MCSLNLSVHSERHSSPDWNPANHWAPAQLLLNCFLPLQAGMPRTLTASDMVTPGSLSPPPTESTEGEQAGQPLLDGAPSSASLETLIQHLVPTADYYPEVGEPPGSEEGAGEHGTGDRARNGLWVWGVGAGW